ncbi:MAG: BrnT family toxin [Anaerolineae bacterium]|nr:BrnT family toxin [Anaerolineae bacterium]
MEAQFEWDADKAARNTEKHRVSFDEAATVFNDPMFITFIDEEHSTDEERYITIGLSKPGRLLIVAHTDREGRIRIISARKATKKEERFYAEAERSRRLRTA